MPTDDELVRYADVALQVGLVAVDDRRLLVRAHVESVDFVRVLVRRAYELGGPRVDVQWTDPRVDVITATSGPPSAVEVEPDDAAQLNTAAARGDAFLRIGGGEFPRLDGDVGRRYATIDATWRVASSEMFERARGDGLPWAVVCYPTAAWARQVFPDDPDPVGRLWDAIARVSRLDHEDPVASWRAHAGDLDARAQHVTGLDLVELRYEGPGTDLTVGVAGRTGAELVFVDGVVTSATCTSGQSALDALLDTDEGSRRLGEVALVPHSSRVARERLQWHHPLYDENEDCHVALGMSYLFTAPGATELDRDEQLAIGLNQSRLHEDVVVGSGKLNVTGVDVEGHHRPLLVGGEWGFTPDA